MVLKKLGLKVPVPCPVSSPLHSNRPLPSGSQISSTGLLKGLVHFFSTGNTSRRSAAAAAPVLYRRQQRYPKPMEPLFTPTIRNSHIPNSQQKLALGSTRNLQSWNQFKESETPEDEGPNNSGIDDSTQPLLLSPFIENGFIEEAQSLSLVKRLLEPHEEIESYSGYLTVNPKLGSNLFFWFFPSLTHQEDDPVILWLNGGPGASSMFGLFAGHGPVFVDANGNLQRRRSTWALNHSVLYIDSPVGTGFSFTNEEDGYARTLDDVTKDLYEALRQFFNLFPRFRARDFYIAGQSYAGKYAPALAYKIHQENIERNLNSLSRINLKGLAIGSGLCDPLIQTDYGSYLYNIGLIDDSEKSYFDNKYKEVCELICQENWAEAHQVLQYLMVGWPRPIVSRFETVTGYTFNSNYLHENMPVRYAYYIDYIQQPNVRSSIHVGSSVGFGSNRNKVYNYLGDDFPQSVKPTVEFLLNNDYKILFYASQLDIIVPHPGISKFINSLDWKSKNQYYASPRKIWKPMNYSDGIGGYAKEYDNLVYLLLRNAGHIAPHDKPEECLDMISRFTRNQPF